jgi:uncharacterized membrane protein
MSTRPEPTRTHAYRARPWVVLLLAVAVHGILHLPAALLRREIRHDEAITLLAATGHQGEYDATVVTGSPPHGAWAPAGAWKRMLAPEPEKPADPGTIAQDLAALDLHPPLYFWLLAPVVRGFGAGLGPGLGLNLALDVITVLAVFFLTRRLVRDERVAALAALLWSVSPGPLEAALEMRQYSLLGLLAALWALAVARTADGQTRFGALSALALASLAALGMLTHYHFALLIGGGQLVVLYALFRTNRQRALLAALATATGACLGLAAHPNFIAIVARQGAWAERFAFADLGARVYKVLVATGNFFVWGVPFQIAWVVAFVVAAALALRGRIALGELRSSAPAGVVRAWILLALVFGAQVALFMLFRSPSGAMRSKYMTTVYPWMAALVAWAISRPAPPRRAVWAVFAVTAVSALVLCGHEVVNGRFVTASLPVVTSARRLVIDTAARGSLPLTLWNVPDDTPVFAASQRELLEHPERWQNELMPGTIVVIDPSHGSPAGREALVRLLAERLDPVEIHADAWRKRVVFKLLPKGEGARAER